MCSDEAVQRSAIPEATAIDTSRCEAYLVQGGGVGPDQYSSAMVTNEQGVARCSNVPNAIGMSFADREIFQQVRSAKAFVVGTHIASRLGPRTVVPVALPLLRDEEFAGMCAVGITLKALADAAAASEVPGDTGVAVIDRNGVAVGGNAEAMRGLPTPARLTAAVVGGQTEFAEYGQDGSLYEFRIQPIANSALFAVTSIPLKEGLAALAEAWSGFVLVLLAFTLLLLVTWLAADRWCVRPLRYIQEFAEKVARGESIKLAPHQWAPELASVGSGVKAMADAIASRETELRAGLEQRDHMLREIHHRVKNNLQMISSLLNLQAGEIRSPRIRRFFGDAQNRVLTLSILHRHLYERSSWSLVDFQQFISDLVRQISVGRMSADRPAPRYHIRAPIMAVGPDTAIPIGLIVTEAVSIALAHDFDGVSTPEIRIDATESDGQVTLVVEDNGMVGSGGVLGADGSGGFGLTLIRGLAMQLGGEAQVSQRDGGGARFVITFPTPGGDEEGNA
jgi:two-component sensor histidine kinase